jgi:hypothetical protein
MMTLEDVEVETKKQRELARRVELLAQQLLREAEQLVSSLGQPSLEGASDAGAHSEGTTRGNSGSNG